MTQPSNATTAVQRVASGTGRLVRVYRELPHERRLAVYASIGLFLAMFLPWYQREFFAVVAGKPVPASDTQTAWGAFSFVEAAVLLVAAGVLTLLFQRAEGRAFHLPGGDGGVITAAGLWTCVLVVWRIFDKQGGHASGVNVITYGIEWGIFVALAIAVFLTYAGSRIRAAHRPEPPLPGETDPVQADPVQAERVKAERRSAEPPVAQAVPASAERSEAPRPFDQRRVRPPRPVAADDPPTVKLGERTREPPQPADPDDQLTIPFDEPN